jgi:hypothetical protein
VHPSYLLQPTGRIVPAPEYLPGTRHLELLRPVLKDFKLPREGMKLQFRAEAFNLFNHSNLFVDANTNVLSAGQVVARRRVPTGNELNGTVYERRNIQLALRFSSSPAAPRKEIGTGMGLGPSLFFVHKQTKGRAAARPLSSGIFLYLPKPPLAP